jgi:hypothetical protein
METGKKRTSNKIRKADLALGAGLLESPKRIV